MIIEIIKTFTEMKIFLWSADFLLFANKCGNKCSNLSPDA